MFDIHSPVKGILEEIKSSVALIIVRMYLLIHINFVYLSNKEVCEINIICNTVYRSHNKSFRFLLVGNTNQTDCQLCCQSMLSVNLITLSEAVVHVFITSFSNKTKKQNMFLFCSCF
jgi:hypothetical protein